jgi:hypothetical protein
MKRYLLLFICFVYTSAHSQVTEQDIKKYPFIDQRKNIIHNDSVLIPFFQLLADREAGKNDKVVIAHVGDSHIQADFFSGRIREELQKKFGNAGRGLVFPYRAARSNEPYSIKSSGAGQWKSGRNVVNKDSLPIGIAGFALQSKDTSAMIFLRTNSSEGLDYSFKIVEVFCENDSGFCRVNLKDTATTNTLTASSMDTQKDVFILPSKTNAISILPEKKDSLHPVRIYGVNLLNEEKGLLYHTIGVNGAEFRHYNTSQFFFGQFFKLKPQLVIVSLGTNEAYGKAFNADEFVHNMKVFADSVRSSLPGTIVLFTVPSDSYRGKYRNRTVEVARALMIGFCEKNNYPYWDLFEVMGGAGSMSKWYSKGLTAKDRLHFKPKGYAIQAYLFNEALLNSYNAFSGAKRQ